jgi:hypothetical protein
LSEDEVRLVLPADPDYGRVARVAVAGLAHRMGMSWRAQQDLQIAVDETLILLLHPEGAAGEVSFLFTVTPERLAVDAVSTAGAGQHWANEAARSRFEEIVGPTVDVHEVDRDANRVHLEKQL